MKFPLLRIRITHSSSVKDFVDNWSSFYFDSLESRYSKNIVKHNFDKPSLYDLFLWKNRMNFKKHKKKMISFNKMIKKLSCINSLKKNFDLDKFKKEFKEIGFIWRIFLLHVINPKTYPMIDQNVYRAYQYLVNNDIKEITELSNKNKETFYFETYFCFFNDLLKKYKKSKKIDEALWAFGNYLKSDYRNFVLIK